MAHYRTEHSFEGVPTFLYNLAESVPDPFAPTLYIALTVSTQILWNLPPPHFSIWDIADYTCYKYSIQFHIYEKIPVQKCLEKHKSSFEMHIHGHIIFSHKACHIF